MASYALMHSRVHFLCSRVNFLLSKYYSLNVYMSIQIKIWMAKALIMPLIIYDLEVYNSTNTSNLKIFRLLYKRIIRCVFVFSYNQSYDHILGYVLRFLGCFFVNFIKVRFAFNYRSCRRSFTIIFFFSRSLRNS